MTKESTPGRDPVRKLDGDDGWLGTGSGVVTTGAELPHPKMNATNKTGNPTLKVISM